MEKPALKLVRDCFTMPQQDPELIAVLKERALAGRRPARKSELLRLRRGRTPCGRARQPEESFQDEGDRTFDTCWSTGWIDTRTAASARQHPSANQAHQPRHSAASPGSAELSSLPITMGRVAAAAAMGTARTGTSPM